MKNETEFYLTKRRMKIERTKIEKLNSKQKLFVEKMTAEKLLKNFNLNELLLNHYPIS